MPNGKRRKSIFRVMRTEYAIGASVPQSAIYECSDCENITAFRKGEQFAVCENCTDHDLEQTWYRTNEVLHFVSKNLNTEFHRVETWTIKAADIIAEWAGNVWFVIFHIIWFWFWISTNTGNGAFGIPMFDPYPFGLLTMIVSLEAIFLSTFILISQNRQGQKSELRAELDYQVNLHTEKEVAEILSILRELRTEDKLLQKKTDEILEEANIVLEKPIKEETADEAAAPPAIRRRRARRKSKAHHARARKTKKIMKDAGIDIVKADDELKTE